MDTNSSMDSHIMDVGNRECLLVRIPCMLDSLGIIQLKIMLFSINKISPNKYEILSFSDKEKHNIQKVSVYISKGFERHRERRLL